MSSSVAERQELLHEAREVAYRLSGVQNAGSDLRRIVDFLLEHRDLTKLDRLLEATIPERSMSTLAVWNAVRGELARLRKEAPQTPMDLALVLGWSCRILRTKDAGRGRPAQPSPTPDRPVRAERPPFQPRAPAPLARPTPVKAPSPEPVPPREETWQGTVLDWRKQDTTLVATAGKRKATRKFTSDSPEPGAEEKATNDSTKSSAEKKARAFCGLLPDPVRARLFDRHKEVAGVTAVVRTVGQSFEILRIEAQPLK